MTNKEEKHYCTVEIYSQGWFRLPCLVTIAVILLSLLVFRKLFKERGIPSATAATAGNDASSASASASASASTLGGEYEVFLSFCGKDTRHTFTDFLYTSLVGARIHTFRDDNELRVGENIGPELLKAIKESKISIPIFSKNYASSKWCLRELSQMVECHTSMGQKIFPIFFDVEPSDVRHQRGSYDLQAFLQHKVDIDQKTVQEWKEALKKVGDLKGLELKKETNGHQGELARQVTLKVLVELKKSSINVPGSLFGMDRHVDKMMTYLNVYTSDVQIVGILGMGGIGKTTIAKVIFNQLSERFEGCSFLENVREKSQQKGLVDLQYELCSTILKLKGLDKIVNVNEGLDIIKKRVCTKKVLIVLDDVDTFDQFDKLAGKREWFALGSRIIVTTRDKHVLNRIAADSTYEPPLMESNHSLQLFSMHAFRREFPLEEYDTLSKEFVDIAGGLPLALEIIGSYLCDKEKSNWPGILEMLEEIPHEDVQKKLKISYDALNRGQQQIFLDIACLFIGEDKRVAFYMWDACKFYPADGIDVLVLKCLVKIRDNNVLWMHDQLRDLGRDIVRHENFDEPWKRRRVWSPEDALMTMKKCKETQKDEAINVEVLCIKPTHFVGEMESFPMKNFGLLNNLRYLQVDEGIPCGGKTYVGDLKHLFSKLRWLKWHGFLQLYRVTNFYLENLVILDISWSILSDNWETWNQMKMAKNLKVLNLTSCYGMFRTPDLSTFEALEILILKDCQGLVEIDPSIGNLTSLRVLDISRSSITELPDAIANLEKIEEINASECLELRGEIPDISRLSSLRILKLDFTKISGLPRSICELNRLQTLDLAFGKLQSLPELPSSLTSLRVTCESMKTFPSLSKLKSLKELNFFKCYDLVAIPEDIEKLSELEILTLGETSISTIPAEIGALSRLKILKVDSKNLKYILGLPSGLFELHISYSKSMERLPFQSNLENMSTLYVDWCPKLVQIQGLGKLKSLTSLTVYKCGRLAKLDGLEQLECLRYLDTSMCESLEGLPDLSNLGMLNELNICKCRKLVEVEGLRFLISLEILDMSYCTSLERIMDLSNLKKLKELKFRGWEDFNVILGFEELESLEMLDIAACKFEKSPDLSNLKRLKKLVAFECEKLTKILGLEELISLTLLDISGCMLIENSLNLPNTSILTNSEEAMWWRNEVSIEVVPKKNTAHGGIRWPGYDWSDY